MFPLNDKYMLLNIGICGAVGGNSDNGVNTGTFYFNLNNAPSNTNWNIAAAQTYLIWELMHHTFLTSW